MYEHENHINEGFTSRYNVNKLVHFEVYQNVNDAIHREKEIKGWKRVKKNALVKTDNPEWK